MVRVSALCARVCVCVRARAPLFSLYLRGDALEDVLHVWPRLLGPTRHKRGTLECALLTAAHAAANEVVALRLEILRKEREGE